MITFPTKNKQREVECLLWNYLPTNGAQYQHKVNLNRHAPGLALAHEVTAISRVRVSCWRNVNAVVEFYLSINDCMR